jgi:HEPN domain-containing protein
MTAETRARETLDWLDFAQADLTAATDCLADPHHYRAFHACFWSQQAAEKAIKAALIYANVPVNRWHDLVRLAEMLPDGWTARTLSDGLDTLSGYAVDSRYPGALLDPTHDDALQALEDANTVMRTVTGDLLDHGLTIPTHVPLDPGGS